MRLNRTGNLCGDYLPGLSLTLGSNRCRNCTEQAWQIPVICHVLLVSWYRSRHGLGWIELDRIRGNIERTDHLLCQGCQDIYEPVFRTANFRSSLGYVIAWLNLDLGIQSCFVDGMTACQKLGLQFVFPLYLLSIVVIIIVVCKAGQWPVFSRNATVLIYIHSNEDLFATDTLTCTEMAI